MVILFLYTISLSVILFYCLNQSGLIFHYLRYKKRGGRTSNAVEQTTDLPVITVQLPIFNEIYVVERLIDAVAHLSYPVDKLEIQVLDDSTDETLHVTRKKVEEYQQKGIDIKHIHRTDRTGFKAGALQVGLEQARGEFLAVFDADFVPNHDFLLRLVNEFTDPKIGMVQARWQHINRDYSLLTQAQAFALDAHFSVEQLGRNAGGYFINFNGTAGIWRKECIHDAEGWQADTLTEDLDLSYRAQLKGWQFCFADMVEAPAELPAQMNSIRSQQYRWNKGAAEVAKKMLPGIIKSQLPFRTKIGAFFHLVNSSIYIFVFLTAVLSVPTLFIKNAGNYHNFFMVSSLFIISFFAIGAFYYTAYLREHNGGVKSFLSFFFHFIFFLSITMGLSLHNALAVMQGWAGRKTAFIRTPKFNIRSLKDSWKNKQYVKSKIQGMVVLEGLLTLYFIGGIVAGVIMGDYGLVPYHLMLIIGFGIIFYFSVTHARYSSA